MQSELLKGFRMLDLADEKGALCGKIFADLGADVIKVEPHAGCSTRTIPPFLEDIPGPDRSLYAIAYHAGKRSITLNLEVTEGRDLFTGLVKHSDFVVESFPLGYMDGLGLGYAALTPCRPAQPRHGGGSPWSPRGALRTSRSHRTIRRSGPPAPWCRCRS